jgi:hypothetical protein
MASTGSDRSPRRASLGRRGPTPIRRAAAGAACLFVVCGVGRAGPAAADGPGSGSPWLVSVGDSYVSGEAGRWAGNSNASTSTADALGPAAYLDDPAGTGETIARCHRGKAAEVFIGAGTSSLNLACAGASTRTGTDASGNFKPGLDFADTAAGPGQAAALRSFAGSHNVRMVLVSVGGNDFNFASVVQRCVADFLLSPSWFPNYCNDDASVRNNFTEANVAAVTAKMVTALRNVQTAMREAGYRDGAWTLMAQTYPSPLPGSTSVRYPQAGYDRQRIGGCGLWDRDLDWANSTALPAISQALRTAVTQAAIPGSEVLDLTDTLTGRRLCETGVGLYEDVGLTSWRGPGAVDRTEWVSPVRTVSAIFGPYYVQESLHPNYWAQLAIRSCVRQAWNAGAVRGGRCVRTGSGLTGLGEPVMTLR